MVSRWTTKVWRNVRTCVCVIDGDDIVWYLRFSWARRATVIVSTGDTPTTNDDHTLLSPHYARHSSLAFIFLDKIQSIGIIVDERVLRLEFSETLSRTYTIHRRNHRQHIFSNMVLPSMIRRALNQKLLLPMCACDSVLLLRIDGLCCCFFSPLLFESIEKEAKRYRDSEPVYESGNEVQRREKWKKKKLFTAAAAAQSAAHSGRHILYFNKCARLGPSVRAEMCAGICCQAQNVIMTRDLYN